MHHINKTLSLLALLLFAGCLKDKGKPEYGGYPYEVGKILTLKCAVSGCHNSASSMACAGLDLSAWEALFRGSMGNSSVIPYRPDHSFLFFSINTFPHLGPQLAPTMPINKEALSYEEVLTIKNWISEGAMNNKGEVNFSDHAHHSKVYVSNQGCDLVSVFDAQTKQLIRVFDVGNQPGIESPHDLIVSPDGKYIYVTFYGSNLFQKYATSDHSKVGEMDFFDYSWHAMSVSGDSHTGLVTQLGSAGRIKIIDLDAMTVKTTLIATYPHGCALNYNGTIAYITSQQGNFLYKFDLTDLQNVTINEVPLETGVLPQVVAPHKPYAVSFFPDYSKYAVTCQGTNEIRIFNAANDSLLKVISIPGVPQLMTFSEKKPYLFVSCMSDISNNLSSSQVVIIDYSSLTQISSIFTGFQPRGITVDDENNRVWVANRNITAGGWQPHHTTACAGNNGYVTLIDMNTLQLVEGWKTEVSVDPYCVSISKPQ